MDDSLNALSLAHTCEIDQLRTNHATAVSNKDNEIKYLKGQLKAANEDLQTVWAEREKDISFTKDVVVGSGWHCLSKTLMPISMPWMWECVLTKWGSRPTSPTSTFLWLRV